ncbi:uncharacterized protein PAC_05760 [Phialocephala subalpina]|uniref:Uncharacterized protein n=1 Tax=Phialocephala subalpina TaxID=576137 RepID=A0A1L7WSX8_9HELO|nr:uncharacterized protein PAC_05760 [Phialocephala subalpina]
MSADPLQAIRTCITEALGTVAETVLDEVKEEIASLKTRNENSLKDALKLYQTQNEELSREQEELQGQLDQVKKSLEKEEEKVTAANAEITKLQQSLKEKDESLRNLNTKVSNTDNQLQDLKEKNASLLQNTTRLSELEGFAKELHEDETWIKQLDTMWESARQLVNSYLKEDVPEDKLKNLGTRLKTWKEFRESRVLNRLPLPRSNSPAAKQMRIAAMLTIIARCIDQHIFHPTYILGEDKDKDGGIRPLLADLATTDSKKESHLRGLLLSIEPKKQAENASKRVGQVVAEVAPYAQDVLSAAQFKKFKSGLKQVVQQALEAWQIAQCTREKFELFFALDDDFEWQRLSFEDCNAVNGEQSTERVIEGDEELLVIFPQIYSIRDDGWGLATDGVVLTKSQSLAAEEEVEAEIEKEKKEKKEKERERERERRKPPSSRLERRLQSSSQTNLRLRRLS